MMTIEPTGAVLGATVRGDRSGAGHSMSPCSPASCTRWGITACCGFRLSSLNVGDVQRFSELFGEIQGSISRQARSPTRCNTRMSASCRTCGRTGKYIGSPDAGQDWHTDMSYRDVMGFVNVLYGIRIPRRERQAAGRHRVRQHARGL